jgi:hypothetical protein
MKTIKYLKQVNLLYIRFFESTSQDDILQTLKDLVSNNDLSEGLSIITDYSDAIIAESNPHKIIELADFVLSTFPNRFKKVIWNNVSSSPKTSAGAAIFANKLADSNILYRYFSSLDEAFKRIAFSEQFIRMHNDSIITE